MTERFVVEMPSRIDAPPVVETTALEPLSRFIDDRAVTDIFINGAGGMFVDRGAGAVREPSWRASEREVRQLAGNLIGMGGRHIDESTPCVDVKLPGAMRVHAVLPPVSTVGTVLSIRIARMRGATLEKLEHSGGITQDQSALLREAVVRRKNLLITGAAGSGKTTLLGALLAHASEAERIVTIEDVAELELNHPHHVALEARQANLEGAGGIGLERLVREALRMRPDRLILGECRGAEIRELLTALNTGHDGGAGTVHANSIADVAARLEALGALAGWDDHTVARQVVSAIDLVIHLERRSNGSRRIAAIGEFCVVGSRLSVSEVAL